MAQNRGSLRATIRQLLGETTQTFWLDTMINQWIEDAQLDIVYRTKCKRRTGFITPVAGVIEYVISAYISDILDIGGPLRIYDTTNAQWREKMEGVTQDYMDCEYNGWESVTVTGEPTMYWYDIEQDRIWIYEPPSAQYASSNGLKVPYIVKPTAIANDNLSPDIPEVLFPAIIEFCLARGMDSRGYSDIAAQKLQAYYGLIQSYNSLGKPREDVDIVMKPYYRG